MRIRWRGLELPTRVEREDAVSTDSYGRFTVEPFELGFGTTVGNSLRRILLSSLQGAAVTHVKIKGADHEFMTLPGVREDVTEIILNVKSLVIRSLTDRPATMKLVVKGTSGKTSEIRASDIEVDANVEIVNQDQLLVTLTDDVEFDMELTVALGRSYRNADENKSEDDEDQVIGLIAVDSVFSPVTRVRYRVENTRVGQRTNYDRLIMEIWTNGTVAPEMALVEAAKILRKHLNPFVKYFELGVGLAVDAFALQSDSQKSPATGGANESKMSMPISALDLSVRSSNCLASANINTIGELLEHDQENLLKLRSFGRTSLREVKRKLADHGLSLQSSGEEDDLTADLDDDENVEKAGFSGAALGAGSSKLPPLDSGTMGDLPVPGPSLAPQPPVSAAAPESEVESPPAASNDAENKKEVGAAQEDVS